MNKKIIGILSAVTLLGGAVYLSGQGGFGALSSSVLSGDACTQAGLDAQKAQYEASSDQIASLEEQMSSLEDTISSAEESIATYQARVAEKKQEIKNTNQEVNQLENYIRSQCGIKKTVRGRTTTYSAPDCNAKKNQVANKKQQINNLEKSVKDTNNAIRTARGNIQSNQVKLGQLGTELTSLEALIGEYDACEMTLTGGSGESVVPITADWISSLGEELIENDTTTDTEGSTTTIIPTVSLPLSPPPDNTATPLTMEVNTPTNLAQLLQQVYSANNIFGRVFSNNQTLLGYNTNTKSLPNESLAYSSTSIDTHIASANIQINTSLAYLKINNKKLATAEKKLKKERDKKAKKALQKEISELKTQIATNTATTAGSQQWLQRLLTLKPQVLANPKIVATNSNTAHSVTQSGNVGNQIELYRFTLQTDLPPVSVVDQIVFEVHSSSSPVSFVDGSIQLVEKSSLKPVLNCSQKQTTKTIIDCVPIDCANQDRDCQPVLRDNSPHEYVLVGELQNSMTSGSYAINKIDGIMYNTFNFNAFNTDIINNTRPFQTIFTAGQ